MIDFTFHLSAFCGLKKTQNYFKSQFWFIFHISTMLPLWSGRVCGCRWWKIDLDCPCSSQHLKCERFEEKFNYGNMYSLDATLHPGSLGFPQLTFGLFYILISSSNLCTEYEALSHNQSRSDETIMFTEKCKNSGMLKCFFSDKRKTNSQKDQLSVA